MMIDGRTGENLGADPALVETFLGMKAGELKSTAKGIESGLNFLKIGLVVSTMVSVGVGIAVIGFASGKKR